MSRIILQGRLARRGGNMELIEQRYQFKQSLRASATSFMSFHLHFKDSRPGIHMLIIAILDNPLELEFQTAEDVLKRALLLFRPLPW